MQKIEITKDISIFQIKECDLFTTLLAGMANEAHVLAKQQDIITSLSQIRGINGETIEKTWQFCMFVPEDSKILLTT